MSAVASSVTEAKHHAYTSSIAGIQFSLDPPEHIHSNALNRYDKLCNFGAKQAKLHIKSVLKGKAAYIPIWSPAHYYMILKLHICFGGTCTSLMMR